MKEIRAAFSRIGQYAVSFLKWILLSSLIGGIGGVLGSIFHRSIDYVTELRGEYAWMLYLLPVGGLVIVWLYHTFHANRGVDTNLVLESVRVKKDVPFMMAPLIFIGTVITHLVGGSAGREGAALQLGGSVAYRLGKLLRLKSENLHIMVMSGMSAVFAAMFGTPMTAAFFAIEVTSVGIMFYAGFVPCLISALIAYTISILLGVTPVRFALSVPVSLSLPVMLRIMLLALLCAIVSILFCVSIRTCSKIMKKGLPNAYLRVIVGAVLLIGLTHAVGSFAYNGAGMDMIELALDGNARPEAFMLKILFTAITIAAGYKGGEIVPAFFVGATFGCWFGGLIGLDAGLGAAVGLIALFCAVVNCPVASVFLAIELFGATQIPVFCLVCATAYMMSGNFSLYRSQTIMYSKLTLEKNEEAESGK